MGLVGAVSIFLLNYGLMSKLRLGGKNEEEGKEKGDRLAIVGSGTIGRLRALYARNYPGVAWLGVCDVKENLVKQLAEDAKADFFTTDYKELLKRPEITATIISTDENNHVAPTLAAVEQGMTC